MIISFSFQLSLLTLIFQSYTVDYASLIRPTQPFFKSIPLLHHLFPQSPHKIIVYGSSLKGTYIKARGNALGIHILYFCTLKGYHIILLFCKQLSICNHTLLIVGSPCWPDSIIMPCPVPGRLQLTTTVSFILALPAASWI